VKSWIRAPLRLVASIVNLRIKVVFEAELQELKDCTAQVPVVFRPGSPEELNSLATPEFGYDQEGFQFSVGRFRAGDTVVLGLVNDQIVFYCWVMFGQMDIGRGDYLPIPSDTAYPYKGFTRAEFRGARILPAFFTYLRGMLQANGYKRIVTWADLQNRASIRSQQRAGLRKAGLVWHVRFLSLCAWLYMSPRLRAGISTERRIPCVS
jgi:hypothetical protein